MATQIQILQQKLKKLESISSQSGDESIQCVETLIDVAENYQNLNQDGQALKYYAKALNIIEKQEDSDSFEYLQILGCMSLIQKKLGRYMEAQKILLRCLSIIEGQTDIYLFQTVAIYRHLSQLYKIMQRYQQSINFRIRTLIIFQEKGMEETIQYANALIQIGNVYCVKKDPKTAGLIYLFWQEAQRIIVNVNSKEQRSNNQ